MKHISFNKPYLSGKELEYIRQAVASKKISGDGAFTQKCHEFFERRYGFRKSFLTTSCTAALEMCALLIDIRPGDEVIAPAYAFVSTANAFVLRGAKVIFADSESATPNLDSGRIEPLITHRTKAVVVVHYAGVACNMDPILSLAEKHGFFVIEDAAHAIDSLYKARALGSLGHLSAFSFHETKNVTSGEGGMLVVNDERFRGRAEIIREKGTNRSAFFRGETEKYWWVDIGSSFLPSDIIAAFLYAQLENLEEIQRKRLEIWTRYHAGLKVLELSGKVRLPFIPEYASNNAHMFYLICGSDPERARLIEYLSKSGIDAVFHYLPLHKSPYYGDQHDGRELPLCDYYAARLLRLPFYYELDPGDQEYVIARILEFYEGD